MELYVWRFVEGKHKGAWSLTSDSDAAQKELEQMRAEAPEQDWQVEVNKVALSDDQVRKLAGALMGSIKSASRASASRTNGALGGRPRKEKPIS